MPKSWTCQMCDIKSSNAWTPMVSYSSNSWIQIVQVPVLGKLAQLGKLAKGISENLN